jgi:hypothetical protein
MTERWGDKRVKEENRVVIEVAPAEGQGDAPEVNAFTKDISPSGARILTDRLFPLHSTLRLTLYLSRSKQIVRTRGTIRWEKGCGDGLYEMGVRFRHGIPNVLTALINHLYGQDDGIPTALSRM